MDSSSRCRAIWVRSSLRIVTPACFDAQVANVHQLALTGMNAATAAERSE